MIITELEQEGKSYRDENFSISTLFFADDVLLLANTIEDRIRNITLQLIISKEYGLNIHKNKSNITIHNSNTAINSMDGIQVINKIKYLGIENYIKQNLFNSNKVQILDKALKLSNTTYPVM